jgi:hypothetical protein
MINKPTIESRIAGMLSAADAKSDAIAALITEVEVAAQEADATATKTREEALDPATVIDAAKVGTCSAACFRRAHPRCVCVPSPSTGSGHRKCGNAIARGRRCMDATRGLSDRLWNGAFSNPVKSLSRNSRARGSPN